jgi:CxxC motif-containing protein
VSVKTNKPIAKKYLKELAKMTHSIEVEAPIEIGQVIVPNIIENGIDLIATRRVKSKRIKDNRQKKVMNLGGK